MSSSTKRSLTSDEIEYILSECQHTGLTAEQNAAVTESALRPIRESLEQVEVFPEIIEKLKQTITRKFYKSRVEAGNCVGVTMGQVLGEDQTQAELNKFHQAGAGVVLLNGISGVQRFNELLVCSTKPKGQLTSIYFNAPPSTIIEAKNLVKTDLQEITLEQLILGSPEYNYSETGFQEDWYELFEEFFEEYLPQFFSFAEVQYRIKLRLDAHALAKWGLTEITILEALADISNLITVCSPTDMLEIHIFVENEFSPRAWISELHQYYITNLSHKTIAGIQGVEAIHFKRDDDNSEQWVALAEGERITRGNSVKTSVSRYIQILSLDYIDQFLTLSNNMWDIVTVYGIEAVRELMIYEFLTCSGDVYSKNSRHVELLVDIMLYAGKISAVSKNGVNPDTAQILLRASFEQVIPQLTSAAVHTEKDDISSISAGMMCGSICKVGTAMTGLLMK
jgi:DNA-directed RNA polymerase II subunit RPB1